MAKKRNGSRSSRSRQRTRTVYKDRVVERRMVVHVPTGRVVQPAPAGFRPGPDFKVVRMPVVVRGASRTVQAARMMFYRPRTASGYGRRVMRSIFAKAGVGQGSSFRALKRRICGR